MTFTVEHTNPAIIALSGNVLGGADAMEFSKAVGDLIREGAQSVILDLTGVELMNSSGLGMLVSASKSLHSVEGDLVVVGANEKIKGLFKMTRLDSVFTQFATREEGVSSIQQN